MLLLGNDDKTIIYSTITINVCDVAALKDIQVKFFTVDENIEKNLKSKSNLSLYSLYYAEACNELAGPISASLRQGNTASLEEMSQRWKALARFDRLEI